MDNPTNKKKNKKKKSKKKKKKNRSNSKKNGNLKKTEPEIGIDSDFPQPASVASQRKDAPRRENIKEGTFPPSPPTNEPNESRQTKQRPVTAPSQARHWGDDKTMAHKKTGRWSNRESRVLMAEMQRVAEENGIEVDELCGYRKQSGMPNLDKIWHTICVVLPNRSMRYLVLPSFRRK